jgi:hypothetical protein
MINPEEQNAEGIVFPTGETKFTRDSDDKNFVKVVMDDEHNKAFIAEFNEKLKACATEQDEEKLKQMFKNMTGLDFDEICPPETSEKTTSEVQKESEPIDSVKAVEVDEESDEITAKDQEYHQNTIAQLDKYVNNPEELKFTPEEVESMRKLGAFDRETINTLVKQLNDDIDAIIAGTGDPMSPYYDDDVRRKAIKDTLEIKIRAQEAMDAAKDFEESGAALKVFEGKFPQYAERGPAWILEDFLGYLNHRTATPGEAHFLYHELNTTKKLKEIIQSANERLFAGMKTTKKDEKTGEYIPYTMPNFIYSVLFWNKSRLALLTNIQENEVVLSKFDSLMLVFAVLFVRCWYKKYAPDIQSNSLSKRLFYKFVSDNSNPMELDGQRAEWLNDAWNAVWEKCADISNNCNKLLTAKK